MTCRDAPRLYTVPIEIGNEVVAVNLGEPSNLSDSV